VQIAADECPSGQTERLAAESATEFWDIKLQQMSALQCKRLAVEIITERDTRFYSERETDCMRPLKKKCQVWMWQSKTRETTDCSVEAKMPHKHGYIGYILIFIFCLLCTLFSL